MVAAKLSSLPEVGGSAAYYAERQSGESYASKLSYLDSATVREDAVHCGIEWAANFDWLQTFQKTKSVYLD